MTSSGDFRNVPENKPDIPETPQKAVVDAEDSFGVRFGRLVRRKRGIEGLTQAQLAAEAFDEEGRANRISEIERGHVENPSAATVDALAVALNIQPEELNALYPSSQNRNRKENAQTSGAGIFPPKRWLFAISTLLLAIGLTVGFIRDGAHQKSQQSSRSDSWGATTQHEFKVSPERRRANRCREQLLGALESGNYELANNAANCAETGYKTAIDEGDAFGAFGLYELYQDTRLTPYFAHIGDRPELNSQARNYWCKFAISEAAASAQMGRLFNDIVCD